MVYLMLAILCSSSIAIIFKFSEGRNLNRYAVTSANYLTAFMVSLFMIFSSGLLSTGFGPVDSSFRAEITQVVWKNTGVFSTTGSLIWASMVGIIAGFFFFFSFIYYQKSVKQDGVGLAGTFSKLGILVPMSLSIILWSELPGIVQWIGIVLSIGSIFIVNGLGGKMDLAKVRFTLVLLFLFGGLAEFSNKMFQRYALLDYKNFFLFFVFFTAFLVSIVFTFKAKQKVRGRDLLTGIMVGIPNLFSSFFLILALDTVATSVAFPIYSAVSIVVINLFGWAFFKERLSTRERAAVVMTVIALILINLN